MIDTFEQELIAMNESFNIEDQAMINGLDTIYALENTIDSDSDYFMEETNSKKENPIIRFFKFIIAQIKKFASQISQKVQNWINVHKFKSLLERIHRMKYNGAKTVEIPDLDKLYNVTEKSSKEILKYCDQIIDRCKSGKFKKADVEKMQNYMEKQAEKYKAEEKAILDKHIKYDIKKALSMVEKYLSILTKKDPVIAETESRLNKMMSVVEHYDFSKDTSSPSDVTKPIQKGTSWIRNHRLAFTGGVIAAATALAGSAYMVRGYQAVKELRKDLQDDIAGMADRMNAAQSLGLHTTESADVTVSDDSYIYESTSSQLPKGFLIKADMSGIRLPINSDEKVLYATAFCDIITSDNKYVYMYTHQGGKKVINGVRFFEKNLNNPEFIKDTFLNIDLYMAAVKKYGPLKNGECFAFVPMIQLGGSEDINHIKKVKMKEHVAILYDGSTMNESTKESIEFSFKKDPSNSEMGITNFTLDGVKVKATINDLTDGIKAYKIARRYETVKSNYTHIKKAVNEITSQLNQQPSIIKKKISLKIDNVVIDSNGNVIITYNAKPSNVIEGVTFILDNENRFKGDVKYKD